MEGEMSGSAECVVKAPEGPWLTHHHHSFLSHLTDKIKDTGSQKKTKQKNKNKKTNPDLSKTRKLAKNFK